jgi:hypothetical protein
MDDSCVIKLIVETVKDGGVGTDTSLFAESIIKVDEMNKLEYFLQQVVDSSRYFAIKIENKTSGRTAHIGVGFREREDAINFRMALQDYERSILRECKAEAIHQKFEDAKDTGEDVPDLPEVSKLTLKEGQKIHIKIKGYETVVHKEQKKVAGSGCGIALLLKKPPPPASVEEELGQKDDSAAATDNDDDEWTDFQS